VINCWPLERLMAWAAERRARQPKAIAR
jgi:hypothetical protein